jgi:predicted outer membrane repeat protein
LITISLSSCSGGLSTDLDPCTPQWLVNAVHAANKKPDLTEISLEPGCTYTFTEGNNQDGGAGGNALPLITSPIKIIGNDATLLRGETSDQFRFFWITSSGNLRLEDLRLENGYGLAISEVGGGGAIMNDGGTLVADNVMFTLNQGFLGGAIYNSGSLIIQNNSEFLGNISSNIGGAIYIVGSGGLPISLSDATFVENRTLGSQAGSGGAIYIANTDGALLGIDDSTFENNSAGLSGGAIYNAAPDTTVHLNDLLLMENSADQNGGAIYFQNGSMLMYNSLLAFNRAWNREYTPRQSGGAIYLADGSHQISHASFYDNVAYYGGGSIFIDSGDVSLNTVHIKGSSTKFVYSFEYTEVDAFGGGIFNNGDLTIDKAFIENCHSEYGGGLINRGSATLTNVVLLGNRGTSRGGNIYSGGDTYLNFVTMLLGDSDQGGNIYVYGGSTEVKNSIFDQPRWSNCVVQGGNFSADGENIAPDDDCPGFSIQGDPGLFRFFGALLIELLPESPALNAAIDCTDLEGNMVIDDMRDYSRPQPSGGGCDIGATEMIELPQPPPPAPGILPRLSAPENLTCREGDSNDYPAAGYLMSGETADVIGQNRAGTWLVINNPDWEGTCWIFGAVVELEGDLGDTPILTAPPLVLKQDGSKDKTDDGSSDSSPKCSGYLSPEDCNKAGGSYKLSDNPPCTCPP